MYKRLKSKYTAISYAEEAAEEFKEDIETACNSADFPFILCLLQADEKAEEIVSALERPMKLWKRYARTSRITLFLVN